MASKSLLSLAVTAVSIVGTMAASSNIVTSLPIPGTMPSTVTASVVADQKGLTTWALDCANAPCIASPKHTLTITENPTTLIYGSIFTGSADKAGATFTVSVGCDINSSKGGQATCIGTYVNDQFKLSSTTTSTFTWPTSDYLSVVVTAGAEKLTGKAAVATGAVETGAASAGAASTGATSTGAAAPANTKKALLAGAAAAAGGAALIM